MLLKFDLLLKFATKSNGDWSLHLSNDKMMATTSYNWDPPRSWREHESALPADADADHTPIPASAQLQI